MTPMDRETGGHELLGFLPDDRLDAASGLFIKFMDRWEHLEEAERAFIEQLGEEAFGVYMRKANWLETIEAAVDSP